MLDFLQKRKEIKNHLFDSTLYDRHNPVQVCDLYGMTRYESFTHTPQPRIITNSPVRHAVSRMKMPPVREYASSLLLDGIRKSERK